ncbi:unnamed protein product [Paramecium pentaurelia]|uniref:DNA primase n=1 Tax=Paramecium pentaurelia TaxID=43138 RepID=A0A8S1XF47_9CILI|nr:unnamed protein product [Paramecium pentaurelia]
MNVQDQNEFERNLYAYYKHLFPIQMIVEWLTYAKDNPPELKYFNRREFSFERSIGEDTFYQRYQQFQNAYGLQKFLLDNQQNDETSSLIKYDIGAVFDKLPKKGEKLKALEKEIVIDIDMDAYDEVRTCCQGAKICEKCWKFLQVACEILRPALFYDFGLEHILAVYSGRRGIHLWVCDSHIRKSTNEVRSAIIGYLNINIGNADSEEIIKEIKQEKIEKLHPSIQRAYMIAQQFFKQIILVDQNSLKIENVKKKILTILKQTKILNPKLEKLILETNDSFQIWEIICSQDSERLEIAKLQIILMCLYPRLDAHVSTTINHLLKGPFSIHPKTQRVCVPFNLKDSSQFNPLDTPTLPNIIQKLAELPNELKQRENENKIFPFLGKEIQSLKKYIELFEDFISKYNKPKIN